MHGTFVPEEYVHIRDYYDLIDLKKKPNQKQKHEIGARLVKAVGKNLSFGILLGFSQTIDTLGVWTEAVLWAECIFYFSQN